MKAESDNGTGAWSTSETAGTPRGLLADLDLGVSRFLAEGTPRPPPFLMGAALVFWGWQSELIFPGLIMAFLLEAARWSTIRWEISTEDFNRIWTFCCLLFLASLVYAFTDNEGPSTFASLLQDPSLRAQSRAGSSSARTAAAIVKWLPMVFFLFIAAQAYSSRQGVPIETVSLILRRRWKKARKEGRVLPQTRSVDISWVYFALCLFGSSIQNSSRSGFFWGACFLLGWALWSQRSPRYNLALWSTVLASALALGFFGQAGLGRFQRYLENLNPQWFTHMSSRGTDSGISRTAIGRVGRLKLSHKIVVRVETAPGMQPPALLREASYREYRGQAWYSAFNRNELETVSPETNQTSWVLIPDRTNGPSIQIGCYLPGGKGVLPLPSGSGKLEDLHAFLLYKNPLGAVVAEGPGLVIFDAIYTPGPTIDAPPNDLDDLSIAPHERDAVESIAEELGLAALPANQRLARIRSFFEQQFTYDTYQPDAPESEETPLGRFLLRDRRGHCEFFATAAVLLCRQAGIPARYAVGYAVHEGKGEKYVVRERDAHAWAIVWNSEKSRWQDFDVTPESWIQVEGGTVSDPWRALSDAWSQVWYELSKLRWRQSSIRSYIFYGLMPVLGVLLYQIVFRKRKRTPQFGKSKLDAYAWPGLDSEFYSLEVKLARLGLMRPPHQTVTEWLDTVCRDYRLATIRGPLNKVLSLHYRYRFDPAGLDADQREELRREAQACLTRL